MKRNLTLAGVAVILLILTGWVLFNQQRAQQATEQSLHSAPRPVGDTFRVPKYRVLKDPLAREVLPQVGADIASTEIWSRSINNRELPANERQDLIEDLNEEGFPNLKKLTPDDLPLILSRIELIELLAPSAIDDVNAAAFKEAQKDLIAMRDRLLQQAPPPAAPVAGQP